MTVFELLNTWNTAKGIVNIIDVDNIEDSVFYGDLKDALKSEFVKCDVVYWNADDNKRYVEIGI
jgi:hypothetical protein